MEWKILAAVISSLVSQTLLSLLKIQTIPNDFHLLPLFLHIQQILSTTLLIPSKKRKSTHDSQNERDRPTKALILRNPKPNLNYYSSSFNMSSSTFEWLCGLLDPLLDSYGLPGPIRLAIGLTRLATGDRYPDIATEFAVSESVARLCVKRLCRVLCTNFRFWITFPQNPSEILEISNGFESVSLGLQGCCGAIGYARFDVGNEKTVGAQIVCDSKSRILNIVVGFRGDRNNAEILEKSELYKDVNEGRILSSGQYFVGGVGYPLLSWLVVPYANEGLGAEEEEFNEVHELMCQPVERAFSGLSKWKVLDRLMEEDDEKVVVASIVTCAILHNVLIMQEDNNGFLEDVLRLGFVEKVEDKEKEDLVDKGSALRTALAMKAREVRRLGKPCE